MPPKQASKGALQGTRGKDQGLPAYILEALRQAGLNRRRYQELATLNAIQLLRRGANVEVNLPPGTGKTLIGQMIACMWLREDSLPASKTLCILPNTNLRQQHFAYAHGWAERSGLCKPLQVSSRWLASKTIYHQQASKEANLWFALPEVFANAVARAYIPYETLRQVGLILIDEYDSFSIGVLNAEGQRLRFSSDFARVLEILGSLNGRYVLMSATPARQAEI